MRLVICAYLAIFFLCGVAMLRHYRHTLVEFMQLRVDLTHNPVVTLQDFCASSAVAPQVLALQCQPRIATRQRDDVCAVVEQLSFYTRRYYYLELDCHLHSKLLAVPLPKVRLVVFG